MEELIELFNNLQINDITVIDELFMEKIYEMKQNNIIYDEIYDGESIDTLNILNNYDNL